MYDIYRHIARTELRLIVPRGVRLPERARKERWRLTGRRQNIPKIVADEIGRSGFSIVRPRPQKPQGDNS